MRLEGQAVGLLLPGRGASEGFELRTDSQDGEQMVVPGTGDDSV